jgi:hypothetical protein
MNALVLYILGAMRAWVPEAEHRSFERPEVTADRYDAIAADIALAVDGRPDAPAAALRLASIAALESRYAASVDSCRVHGGTRASAAWGIWQLTGPKDLCSGGRVRGAKMALALVDQSLDKCKSLPAADRLAYYTDGRCNLPAVRYRRSRDRLVPAIKYAKVHPFAASDSS